MFYVTAGQEQTQSIISNWRTKGKTGIVRREELTNQVSNRLRELPVSTIDEFRYEPYQA